jgi:hypothetical protein
MNRPCIRAEQPVRFSEAVAPDFIAIRDNRFLTLEIYVHGRGMRRRKTSIGGQREEKQFRFCRRRDSASRIFVKVGAISKMQEAGGH